MHSLNLVHMVQYIGYKCLGTLLSHHKV